MGELRIFTGKATGEALTRLVTELQRSVESGDNLGPRDEHVRAAATNLFDFAIELRATCAALAGILRNLNVEPDEMLAGIRDLADKAEALARATPQFPARPKTE